MNIRSKFLISLLIFFVCFGVVGIVHAHPTNSTSTTIILAESSSNSVDVTFLINWVQLNVLVDALVNEEAPLGFLNYHFDSLSSYVELKAPLIVNGKQCKLDLDKEFSLQRTAQTPTDIALIGKYMCTSKVVDGLLKIDLFNEFSSTQNYVTISKLKSDGSYIPVKGGVLSDIDNTLEFTSDVTYADAREDISEGTGLNNRLLKVFESHTSVSTLNAFLVILLVSVSIGALHALEGGHSKIILAAIMVDKKTSIEDGFIFTTIFTLTHMSDLIVIGILLLVLNSFRDIYAYANQIQMFAIYSMILVSLWQLLKEISHFAKHKLSHIHSSEHSHEHVYTHSTTKEKFLLAFLEGLSPCLMGWTILLIVISTGALWLLLPVLISFALGIYLVLLTFMLFVYKFKSAIHNRLIWFSEYSGLISAILLVITAFYLANVYL